MLDRYEALLPGGGFNGRLMKRPLQGERYVHVRFFFSRFAARSPRNAFESRSVDHVDDPRLRDRSEDAIRCLESNRDALSALSPCGLFSTKADVFLRKFATRESTDSPGNDRANDESDRSLTAILILVFFRLLLSFFLRNTLIFPETALP